MPESPSLAHSLDSLQQAHRWYVYCRRFFKIHILQVTGASCGDLLCRPSSGSALPYVIICDGIFRYYYHLSHLQMGKVRLREITISSHILICHQSVNTPALSPHMLRRQVPDGSALPKGLTHAHAASFSQLIHS